MVLHSDDETFEQVVYNSKICIYVSLAGLVMLLYDHMLTFADEVELVWKAPRSVARTLFLINRYGVPSMVIGSMHAFSAISQSTFDDIAQLCTLSCRSWVVIALVIGVFSIAISNFIVLLRLWVLWERQKRLIAFTFSLFVVCQLATMSVIALACIKSYESIVYYVPFKTCLFVSRVNVAWLWVPGVVFDSVIFTSASWNALQRPRVHDRVLTRQFYRDGSLFFSVLLAMRVLHMIIAFVAPASLTTLGTFLIWCSTALSVSRLVMNLRRAALQKQVLYMLDTGEAGTIVHRTEGDPYEHYEDSQLSRNTIGDLLELGDMHD